MLMRIFVISIIVIAVVFGICALNFDNRDKLINLIYFRDFFDVSLPILGFGALVKYLCTCCFSCKECHKK